MTPRLALATGDPDRLVELLLDVLAGAVDVLAGAVEDARADVDANAAALELEERLAAVEEAAVAALEAVLSHAEAPAEDVLEAELRRRAKNREDALKVRPAGADD